jgi:RimJ/RimL family protein N-acetyltransferase
MPHWSLTEEIKLLIEFRRLSDIDVGEIIKLVTHPLVRRHMPLSDENFGEAECRQWVQDKERQWQNYGYGPWAFMVDGKFVGWGGLQYEDGDPDLALVLHPQYWGIGKSIYDAIIHRAFGEMGFKSVTILLPPSRTRVHAILRLGFVLDGEVELFNQRFIRYRLHNRERGHHPHTPGSAATVITRKPRV